MPTIATLKSISGGLGVVIGFPLLLAGIYNDLRAVTVAGLIIFAVGLLSISALRFVPQGRSSQRH